METTWYFEHIVKPERVEARREDWIQIVLNNPVAHEVQADGRIRYWGYIEETEKYLRVVVLEDNVTVHNAFFDRSFKRSVEREGRR